MLQKKLIHKNFKGKRKEREEGKVEGRKGGKKGRRKERRKGVLAYDPRYQLYCSLPSKGYFIPKKKIF